MAETLIDPAFWQGKRVLLTGHTGFKGAWLTLLLNRLGASVTGYALDPPTNPSLFGSAKLSDLIHCDIRADLSELACLRDTIQRSRPQIAVHMAAQSLVGIGFSNPVLTFASNVMGTVHLLEAARSATELKAILIISSDKCYAVPEKSHAHSEADALGGFDPYSSSKACTEIATAAYRASFLAANDLDIRVASARAGNVIGGGDWAQDRLVPDCIRSFMKGEAVKLRHSEATRPWQHVLDPLHGYLVLCQALCGVKGEDFAEAWNFGPHPASQCSVGELARSFANHWGEGAQVELREQSNAYSETAVLQLDPTKAAQRLDWHVRWGLDTAMQKSASWYREYAEQSDMQKVTFSQIDEFLDG